MRLENLLREKGYSVVSSGSGEYSFDLLAGRRDSVIAIKFVENPRRDKAEKYADDLRRLALSLDVTPLIACEEGVPEDSLATFRGVPSLSLETLERIIEGGGGPFLYFSKGGVYVKIRGEKIRRMRRSMGMSLGDLSYRLGVTRRMVYEYETGRADATLEVAYKLVQLFGEDVVERMDIDSVARHFAEQVAARSRDTQASRVVKDPLLRRLLSRLEEMGFLSRAMERAPFNAVAKGDIGVKCRVLIKRNGSDEEERFTMEVARLCGSYALFVDGEWLRVVGEREVKAPSQPESVDLREMFQQAGLQ